MGGAVVELMAIVLLDHEHVQVELAASEGGKGPSYREELGFALKRVRPHEVTVIVENHKGTIHGDQERTNTYIVWAVPAMEGPHCNSESDFVQRNVRRKMHARFKFQL